MSSTSLQITADNLQQEAIRFCSDTDAYFGSSDENLHGMPRDRLAALQLAALKYRFEDLKDRIPMLQQLASRQNIASLETLEDVVPILFEHTMYKSYPPMLLEKNRFADINKFISRLTTYDLSTIDVSECQSIDEWIEVMDRKSELEICHSSGTSGTMSFLPTSKKEWDKFTRGTRTTVRSRLADPDDNEFYCIYPYYRDGASSHLRINNYCIKHILGDESRFYSAYPGWMSSDVLYLAAKVRAAKANGELDRVNINPALMQRLREFEELQQNMPAHLDTFFEHVMEELRGKRVYFGGTWNLLHKLAEQGLKMGEEAMFAPDSVIISGGGAKGVTPPENWQEDVCRFFGIERILMGYGMSEVQQMHYQCEQGRYHFAPGAIPFLLDPDTSEPLPRSGTVTGRAAFFDLTAETRWGGFITGDELTINWETPCACGRQSYFIEGEIERYSEKQGGDDKISCAATENAHKEAMDFLTHFE
ncbi:MAG: hypothetical protein OXQ27_07085 [Chloroflexota bacterium]|nr:hypothetical protein [Chloroflexota bacterium]